MKKGGYEHVRNFPTKGKQALLFNLLLSKGLIAESHRRVLQKHALTTRSRLMDAIRSIHSIVQRFPLREFELRRLCARDPKFLSICSDYDEATTAFRYWSDVLEKDGNQSGTTAKVEEYKAFLIELEVEILGELDRAE